MLIKEHRDINKLRIKWNRLYNSSIEVTSPLQSFVPNKQYFNVFRLSYHRRFMSPRFIYAKDGFSEIVFPYILDKKRKIIFEYAPLDYYDVIYSGSYDIVSKVVLWMKDRYPGYRLIFNRVNQSASFYDLPHSVIKT